MLIIPKVKSDFHEPAVLDFISVIQCDYSSQMDVLSGFSMILPMRVSGFDMIRTHLHKRILQNVPKMVLTTSRAKNGDGSESQFRAGDLKPAHIHMIIRVRKKMRASTLSKRFCEQVHFEATAKKVWGYL